MIDTAAYKKAAIDFLLTHGTCERVDMDTRTALFTLADRGVDYDASDMPDFNLVQIEAGDTLTDGRMARALSARILPCNPRPNRAHLNFVIHPDNWENLMFSFILRGVIASADAGDSEWKGRYPEERRRYDEQKAEQAARDAGYAAAAEVQAAGGDKAAQTAAAKAASKAYLEQALAALGR